MNKLYYGDCLTVMRDMPVRSVDLIYLDPPFNSNRAYNAIYKDETGQPLPAQIEAFCDQWTLDPERERAIRAMPVLMINSGIDDSVARFWETWTNALRQTQPRLLAYLSYMVERLIWMRLVLKESGALFLHCDETVAHYMKIMLDGVMGHNNFRSEIIWQRAAGRAKGSQHAPKTFGTDTDTIFYYAKSNSHRMNGVYVPLTEEEAAEKFDDIDERGRYTTGVPMFRAPSMGARPNLCYEYNGVRNPHPSGWRVSREKLAEMDKRGEIIWRYTKAWRGKRIGELRRTPLRKSYLEDYKGKPIGSLWTDIPNASGRERLGYDTQKPVDLLDRIVRAGSNKGELVFDPFCGCATTLEAAHKLGRKWIGVDIAIHAIKRVAKVRLEERLQLVEGEDFIIDGVPRSFEGAFDLWERDTYQFQKWCVEQVDGFVTTKRTADGGIDGRLYFSVPGERSLQSMVLEVKGGRNVNISHIRQLGNVLETSGAMMAGLIILHPLTERRQRNYQQAMAQAGDVEIDGALYSRMQMLTVQEIFDGKRFDTPAARGKRESWQKQMDLPKQS